MRYRYYSTQRPVGPGTFPKPRGNRVLEVYNFDDRTYVNAVGLKAWGWVEYERPLEDRDARAYELIQAHLYRERDTGDLFSWPEMQNRFETFYDGGDDTNPLGWEEYFEEI